MRRRAEADVGVRGDDAAGATVPRVEQDQRDWNPLSPHSASQSTSVSVDSSTSFDGAHVTVGVDSGGRGGVGLRGVAHDQFNGTYSDENALRAGLHGTRGGESGWLLVDGVAND
jgi:hypothetical protein